MSDVDFSVTMRPSSLFEVKSPTPDGKGEETRVAAAGGLLLKILCMPREERLRVLSDGVDDEVLVLFAMLTPKERRDVIQAASDFLKQKVAEV